MKQHRLFFTLVLLFAGFLSEGQDSTRKELIGKYKFPAGSVVEEVVVADENGGLTMSSTVGVSVLELVKGDTFNIVSFNGIAVFKRDDAKKITGVHIDASGYVLDGLKDSAAISHAGNTTARVLMITAGELAANNMEPVTPDNLCCFARPDLFTADKRKGIKPGMLK